MSKKKKGKKQKQGYVPIQNILNAEEAYSRAAWALDGAYLAASRGNTAEAEQKSTTAALWLEMAGRLGPMKSQVEGDPQMQTLTSRPFRTGFQGPDEYEEYEEEEYDGTDE